MRRRQRSARGSAASSFQTDPVLLADGSVDVDASVERYKRDLRAHDSILFRLLLLAKGGRASRAHQVEFARWSWDEQNQDRSDG